MITSTEREKKGSKRIGVIGPYALGRQVQNWVHEAFGFCSAIVQTQALTLLAVGTIELLLSGHLLPKPVPA